MSGEPEEENITGLPLKEKEKIARDIVKDSIQQQT
jgi:hypothetical protein